MKLGAEIEQQDAAHSYPLSESDKTINGHRLKGEGLYQVHIAETVQHKLSSAAQIRQLTSQKIR